MKANTAVRLLAVLAVAANVAGVVQYGADHPWTYALLVVVLFAAIIAPLGDRLIAFWTIRRVLAEAEAIIRRSNIHPKRIIAFDRSSAIFGGMLCQRMSVSELVALPRCAADPGVQGRRQIRVGQGLKVTLDDQALSESLVVVFHLRTGATLEAGLRALTPRGKTFGGRVLALFATEGGAAHWPSVQVVRKCATGEIPNERLPWISGAYVHK